VTDKVKVGWCHAVREGSAGLPSPLKVSLEKDPSPTKRGFQSCPAVRSSIRGCYAVNSPFSLRLKCVIDGNKIAFLPVYPFTTLSEPKLREMLRLEPRYSWRRDDVPIFQFPSPYMFVADEAVEVEQLNPVLAKTTSLNWRVIPGRFDIYGWQRPLNWAIEWDTSCGDLIIKTGEPLYFVRFWGNGGHQIVDADLIQIPLTDDLERRMSTMLGVTAMNRGTAALMVKSATERDSKLLPDFPSKP
jgi:hypothetical protein